MSSELSGPDPSSEPVHQELTSNQEAGGSSFRGVDRVHGVLLASRLFAAFLLFWVVDDITELPRELFSVLHYYRLSSGAGVEFNEAIRISYYFGLEMMYLVGNILRIALWLLAAGWFYRCGPRIRKFFESTAE